jgi:hypothetical protein
VIHASSANGSIVVWSDDEAVHGEEPRHRRDPE